MTRGIPCKRLIQWDLEPRDPSIEKHDALLDEWPECDLIVCNPPFTKSKQFLAKATAPHQLWISTKAALKQYLVSRYIYTRFPKVKSPVVLAYRGSTLYPLPEYVDPILGKSTSELKAILRDILCDVVCVDLEYPRYIDTPKKFVGSRKAFYGCDLSFDIPTWLATSPSHHLYAIPKGLYDQVYSIDGKDYSFWDIVEAWDRTGYDGSIGFTLSTFCKKKA